MVVHDQSRHRSNCSASSVSIQEESALLNCDSGHRDGYWNDGEIAYVDSALGKLFASLMAFVSIGAAISAITFTFGPLFGYALKEGFAYVEKEEDKLTTRIEHKEQARSSTDK